MSVSWALAEALGRVPVGDAAARCYTIFVRDLILVCRIGIHEHEKRAPQRVRVNVELIVQERIQQSDDIAAVVSYEDIVRDIQAVLTAEHINLVETAAERIAQSCLSDGRVMAARVRIEKLDILPEAAAVGIEIERRRSDAGQRGPAKATASRRNDSG